jgi:hypothetical protein
MRRLQARLESLSVIEQAKGILMAQQRCGPEEAFDLLRRASQRANIKVHVLAVKIVAETASLTAEANAQLTLLALTGRGPAAPSPGAACAARSSERPGPLGASHTKPDNLRTLRAAIDTATQRAESAVWIASNLVPVFLMLAHRDTTWRCQRTGLTLRPIYCWDLRITQPSGSQPALEVPDDHHAPVRIARSRPSCIQ